MHVDSQAGYVQQIWQTIGADELVGPTRHGEKMHKDTVFLQGLRGLGGTTTKGRFRHRKRQCKSSILFYVCPDLCVSLTRRTRRVLPNPRITVTHPAKEIEKECSTLGGGH